VQPIGQGGFGKTYLAMDEDRLGMRCVIKQFSPQVQGTKSMEKAIALFNQEAVRLHELGEHPQIPTLLAYFEQEGYLYLVQQFIEGQNLLQIMRQQGPFNERQIRDLLADILPVLRFVHNHQVIHRDITPMNILRRQSDDRLILIDFGIAKQLSQTSGEPGTRIGTEGYAPMEQFRGGRAFPASDIYSLGATCLHLMTETRPDHLYDPLEGRWVWRDHLQHKGILISEQLGHMLDMMLKDLVNDRYQSADELMRDLNADYFIPSASGTKSKSGNPSNRYTNNPAGNKPASPAPTSSPPAPQATPSHPPAMRSPASPSPTSKPPTSKPPTSKPPISGQPISRPAPPPEEQATGGRCIYTLTGHSSWVTAVAIAPNGVLFASGSLDDTIKFWNLPMGEVLTTLPGHRKGVNALVISPNGQTLTSGGDDYTLKTWSLSNGALIRTLTGHSRDVSAVVISPDGQILASGAEDRTIRLWHMGTGNLLKTILGVGSMVRSLAITPDGKTLISGGFDGNIKLWSLQTGQETHTLSGHLSIVNAVIVSPANQTLISGSKDKTIRLWDLNTGNLLKTLQGHSRDVNALVITPDGQTLMSGSSDTTIKFWHLSNGTEQETINAHQDSVNTLAISPDGKVLVSGSSDKTIKVWRV
jgi:WD40 repeat protein/tRNA A-37 threonylcarbamoyl transferase component Bud32